jgi:hypothetical protein
MVAIVGAKGAPGATTSALALACGWPGPVLVVDADPAGGDIAAGWLGGRLELERGLLSFAAATRHLAAPAPADLLRHTVAVPDVPGVMVLPGLAHAGQAGGLDGRCWARLAAAAGTPAAGSASATATGHDGPPSDETKPADAPADAPSGPPADTPAELVVDVLTDCGRIGVDTAWPLLIAAEVVLLATRPTLRGVHHARHAIAVLRREVSDVRRVELLVCGPGPYSVGEISRAVGVPPLIVLPDDPGAAAALSDGAATRGWTRGWARTALARAARTAAVSLARTASSAPRNVASAPRTVASMARTGAAVPDEGSDGWAPDGRPVNWLGSGQGGPR